ncbi:MAG: hypothetical protein WCD31_03635 [Gillisia sp.]
MESELNKDKSLKNSRKASGELAREQEKNSEEPKKNTNWDQVQRRHQASPRSYNKGLDEQNKVNQNTQAAEKDSYTPESLKENEQTGQKKSKNSEDE